MSEEKKVRVLCTLPNAGAFIGGVYYGKLANGRVSDEMPESKAAKLCSISGYRMFAGDDGEAAAAVKQAKEEFLASRAGRTRAASDPAKSRREGELVKANQALSQDLNQLRTRLAEAEATIANTPSNIQEAYTRIRELEAKVSELSKPMVGVSDPPKSKPAGGGKKSKKAAPKAPEAPAETPPADTGDKPADGN